MVYGFDSRRRYKIRAALLRVWLFFVDDCYGYIPKQSAQTALRHALPHPSKPHRQAFGGEKGVGEDLLGFGEEGSFVLVAGGEVANHETLRTGELGHFSSLAGGAVEGIDGTGGIFFAKGGLVVEEVGPLEERGVWGRKHVSVQYT